jgi:FkbM family methyltransferase
LLWLLKKEVYFRQNTSCSVNIFYRFYAQIFAKKAFLPFHKVLYRLALRGMGIMNSENDFISGEAFFIKLLSKTNPSLIIDVGANEGQFARLCLEHTQAKVVSFEPHPITFRKLTNNLSDHNEWLGMPYGLGHEAGQFILYDHAGSEGTQHASLQAGVFESVYGQTPDMHQVDVLTLDEFVVNQHISEISLLKIDVEGFELAVLQGAKKLLANRNIKMVMFEFNSMNIAAHASLQDFQSLMPNYRLYRLLPNGLLPLENEHLMFREIFVYQNIVAIPA